MSTINTDQILNYMHETQIPVTKRDLAKAFNLKGDQRIALKNAIRELMDAGLIKKNSRKEYHPADQDDVPAIAVLEVVEINDDGEIFAIPTDSPTL